MKKTQLRTFLIDGKAMIFNLDCFRELFITNASKLNIGIGRYEDEIADALFVDRSAVHNWRMGVNGPGDLDKIRSLAKLWNIKEKVLLREVNTMVATGKTRTLTDRERTTLKNVYSSFLNYMKVFNNTAGFNWNEDGSDFNRDVAYNLFDNVVSALEFEYIDLKSTVYDALDNFYRTEIVYTLEGYFAPEEGDTPEGQKAEAVGLYLDLVEKFKNIIDPYLIG